MEKSFAVEVDVNADPDTVWGVVGDPCGVTLWYPLYTSCRIDGDVRILGRADGVELHERMLERDEKARRYAYSVVAGLPLATHLASFEVAAVPGGSRVVWRTTVSHEDPTIDMEARLVDRQREALTLLKDYIERSAQP